MANTPTLNPPVDLSMGALPTTGRSVVGGLAGPNSALDIDKAIWINEVNPFEFMRHADNGTGGFLYGQYLTNHTRERDFKERRNYSYYLNFIRRIINALTKPIFREEPVRTDATENALFELFMEDCDRRGHGLNDFMKKVARNTKRYGVYFVVVDNDKPADIAPNMAGAVATKQYPYVYCYSPENVVEFEWDALHRIKRIVFREWVSNKDGKKVWQFREWTKEGWTVFVETTNEKTGEKGRNILDSGAITIGEIPVIPVYDEEPDDDDDPILPHPPLYHIARTNLSVYDVCSELRELERNQMFSLMRIPVELGKQLTAIEVGSKNALAFPSTSSHPPDFMSPNAAIPTAIMADRKFLIEQLFEMAALVGIVGTVFQESGRAKEWEFQAQREELTRFGHKMEGAEEDIARIFGKYLKTELDYEVNYSENYGIVDMTAETTMAAEAIALNISPEVNVEIKKDWTLKFFRDSKQELVDKLLESIDKAAADEAHSKAAAAEALAASGMPPSTPTAPKAPASIGQQGDPGPALGQPEQDGTPNPPAKG